MFDGLLIGLVIGVLVDRYIIPIADMLFEMLNLKISKSATEVQLTTEELKLEFSKKHELDYEEKAPLIGFHHEGISEDFCDDEDFEDENAENRDLGKCKIKLSRIGFSK